MDYFFILHELTFYTLYILRIVCSWWLFLLVGRTFYSFYPTFFDFLTIFLHFWSTFYTFYSIFVTFTYFFWFFLHFFGFLTTFYGFDLLFLIFTQKLQFWTYFFGFLLDFASLFTLFVTFTYFFWMWSCFLTSPAIFHDFTPHFVHWYRWTDSMTARKQSKNALSPSFRRPFKQSIVESNNFIICVYIRVDGASHVRFGLPNYLVTGLTWNLQLVISPFPHLNSHDYNWVLEWG